MKSKLYLNINNCARCGYNHIEVPFYTLANPSDDYNLWGTCPLTGEPILAKVLIT